MYDSLGDRMKKNYEKPYSIVLPYRMPLIIRVDGKNFHTLTRGADKPFDERFMTAMSEVAINLVFELQTAVLAYQQSDEVSILLHNYKNLESQPWFGNELQKIVSIAAAIASTAFGTTYGKRGLFDARAFVVPEAEVCNYFIWRQKDAERNSIQMLAQSLYSHKELKFKKIPDLHDMLHAKGVNWNDLPVSKKRGICAKRIEDGDPIDDDIPIFTQNRAYIEDLLKVEE